MADGRHFENRYIAISKRKIIRFRFNFVHSSRFWTGWTSRDQKWKKVALDRLRVRQNVFLVSLFFFFIISVCPVWWTLSWLHVSFSLHIDPSESNGNYSAASNNIKLVNWPLMGVPLHLVQQGKEWAGPRPAHSPPCCTKCNGQPVNSQCIPITALLYNGPLLCGFNVPIKGSTHNFVFNERPGADPSSSGAWGTRAEFHKWQKSYVN